MSNKKVKAIAIGIVALLLLGVGIWKAPNLFPTINATHEIMNALQPFLDAKKQSMYLELDVEAGEQKLQLEADIYAIKEESKEYLVIEQEKTPFYVVDNLILLENGKAFLLTNEELNQGKENVNYLDMIPILATAFDEFQINRTEEKEKISYQIEVTGEQMRDILEATMSSKADSVKSVECLQVELITIDGKLDYIQISGSANSTDSKISISMRISDFEVLADGAYEIPQLIKDSAKNADKDKLFCLTEDLYRLIKAVEPLSDTQKLQGTMNWQLSCGIIQINSTIDLEKLHSIPAGTSNKGEQEKAETATSLIDLMSTMVMEGELSCKEVNGVYVYELVMEEKAMKQFAETISPEMVSYVVNFEKGTIKLEIKEETLQELTIDISGSFNVLFTKIPVSIGVDLNFQ